MTSHPHRFALRAGLALRASLIVSWSALALAACTSLAPTYERPAAPVPAELPRPGVPEGSAPVETPGLAWADFVQQPVLRGLIERALHNNRDLRVAVLNVARAQALLQASQADRWPSLGAGVTAARQPSVLTGRQTNSYTAGVQMSGWELDFFGRIASLNDAARAQLLASEAGRRGAEISLVAAVISSALTVSADAELLALAERSLLSREESARLTQLKYDGGAASALEQQTSQSLLAQARASLAQQRRLQAQDLNALAVLLGEPAEAAASKLRGAPSLAGVAMQGAASEPPPWLAEIPVGLSSQVLLRRPDVVQAEAQLMAANANVGAARAAFFPRITLTSSAGQAAAELADLFKAGHFAWTVAAQALVPLFDAGRNRANLEASRVSRDIAVAQYEKAVQSAFRDTADALAGLGTWRDQLAAQRSQLAAANDIARLTTLRWQNGAASELERLDAERSRYAAEQATVAMQLAELQNRVALFKALGG